jgi:hypothetical protein
MQLETHSALFAATTAGFAYLPASQSKHDQVNYPDFTHSVFRVLSILVFWELYPVCTIHWINKLYPNLTA